MGVGEEVQAFKRQALYTFLSRDVQLGFNLVCEYIQSIATNHDPGFQDHEPIEVLHIVKDRMARAENTKIQQYKPEDLAKLIDGSNIDIWREPEHKNETGWRGPAELIKLCESDNKGIVQWRGMPIMIPINHMRPHIGFTWFVSTSTSQVFSAGSDVALTVAKLMDMINLTSLGLVVAYGLIWQEHLSQFSLVPSDLRETHPMYGRPPLQLHSKLYF